MLLIKCILILVQIGLMISFSSSGEIESGLYKELQSGSTPTVIITYYQTTQAIIDKVSALPILPRVDRINTLSSLLIKLAKETHKSTLDLLLNHVGSITSFWICNCLCIAKITLFEAEAIAKLPEVKLIRKENALQLNANNKATAPTCPSIQSAWGVKQIGAYEVWAIGYKGKGIVVSSIDTGVKYDHAALIKNMRQTYNWRDPYTATPSIYESNLAAPCIGNQPCDQEGHGTHTMGTMAGAMNLGVAPDSTWITCRGCLPQVGCFECALLDCGQWIACPTLPDGSQGCGVPPDVCSNSWGGGQNSTFFADVVAIWQFIDIVPVFSIGNNGSDCKTANSPGDLTTVIGVGSTGMTDQISGFSSRGPTVADKNVVKPDVTSPGECIMSAGILATNSSSTAVMSGTSMSAPHVAGTVALLLSNNYGLKYKQIVCLLENYAVRTGLDSVDTCGGGSGGSVWPSNNYGYGRISAINSMNALISNPLSCPA